jgi:hypothetical protein
MSEPLNLRAWCAGAVIVFSTLTLARLVSKEVDLLFAASWCLITGAAVGALLRNARGALVGAAVGLLAGVPLLCLDIFLWLVFTLPPHPAVDL